MHASGSGEWQTPPALFAWADARWHFTLDAAATDQNTLVHKYDDDPPDPITRGWFTAENDALAEGQLWLGSVWLNPPYGRGLTKWAEACARNIQDEETRWIVGLFPARPDTKTWRIIHDTAALVFLLQGRLTFKGPCGDGLPYDIKTIKRSGRKVVVCTRCEVRVKTTSPAFGTELAHAYDPAPFPSALVLWSHGQTGPASYQMLAKARWAE